jgi:2-(1,2-epoxy-1,2-dihydrophenyl)acetyl-CoA isomerase
MSNQLVKTVKEGPVLVVRLNSPRTVTPSPRSCASSWAKRSAQADGDPSIRAMYLTGEGPTFCSGGDFKMLQTQVRPVARAPALSAT